ncbi:N-6 DNA methylase [Helicobacter pylori]
MSKKARKTSSKNTIEKRFCKPILKEKRLNIICALANMEKIKENDYNLSVNRYVEQEDTKEAIDIKALNSEIAQIVEKQSALRNRLEFIIKELEA